MTRSWGLRPSSVAKVVIDAAALGCDLATLDALTDSELEAKLYPKAAPTCVRPAPDCAALHLELRRPGVTLALLHVEFLGTHPDGVRYTAFCDRYRKWLKRRSPVMRQVHVAGDKMFVDYAGMKPRLIDPTTGEVVEVELFVAVLGASNYTFAEASRTQSVPDFVASVGRALTFFGGVARAIVPDQLKSAITTACRYDPGVQRTTAELARYYDTTILPARPKAPRDKAKVEVGVQVAERWLLARIRNETFGSLGALNARLSELVADLNARTMRTYKTSRRELFERLDKPALMPLPAVPFEACIWKKVALNIDYHVVFEGHFYSAPHTLRADDVKLWLRATTTTVEIFHVSERVAVHVRSFVRGGFTTVTDHMIKLVEKDSVYSTGASPGSSMSSASLAPTGRTLVSSPALPRSMFSSSTHVECPLMWSRPSPRRSLPELAELADQAFAGLRMARLRRLSFTNCWFLGHCAPAGSCTSAVLHVHRLGT